MDALYLFKHSRHADEELRYSLRSLHTHASFLETIWVFGDRPNLLNVDHPRIRHVPHEYTARVSKVKTPMVNSLLMLFHASLIPELNFEFLWMCDDYILLVDLDEQVARRHRYIENLSEVKNRGGGQWKESLWRTYDLLKRFQYPGYNFEVHTPTYLTKKQVFEAYLRFQDFVTEDRFHGPLTGTTIFNYALQHEGLELTRVKEEGLYAGFHHKQPDDETVRKNCANKTFLNFDDNAFGPALLSFLRERFPEPCPFENPTVSSQPIDGHSTRKSPTRAVQNPEPLVGGAFIPPPSMED
jgi:hypothetical protein